MGIRPTQRKPCLQTISPNPARQTIAVTFHDALPFDYQISAIDGKMMKNGISTKDIIVSELPYGLYLLKIQKQGEVFTEKILVEK